jgi:hypothetical protein
MQQYSPSSSVWLIRCVTGRQTRYIAELLYMHMPRRGHKVLVVTTSPTAFVYLKRASARHTSNTTAEAMRYMAAEEAAPVAAQGGLLAAATGTSSQAVSRVAAADQTGKEQTAGQQQQQRGLKKTATAPQHSWKGGPCLHASCLVAFAVYSAELQPVLSCL